VDESLPLSVLQRMAEACDRFEDAWKAGQRPRIEEYLRDSTGPERTALLRLFLGVELHHRLRLGETPRPQEYRLRFAEHADLIDTVFASATQDAAGLHPGSTIPDHAPARRRPPATRPSTAP
jgi:serine/threonine-protein kinase